MNKTTNAIDCKQSATLLKTCAEALGDSIPEPTQQELTDWHQQTFVAESQTLKTLLATPAKDWDDIISSHPAHVHNWYNYISDTIDVNNMASFLLENNHYPTFITMLEKIKEVQLSDDACAAVQENIEDEFEPEPHSNLMRKLMQAVKQRAELPIELNTYPELVDRTLIFYYGYFLQPWHLVGSLFATEQMGTHRVTRMKQGLERMGFSEDEIQFTTVHAECDDHHAADWLDRVIVPSIEMRPELMPTIAAGIAECLDTSALYLDYVHSRAQMRMAG